MSYAKRSHVEHVAVRAADIDRLARFFRNVFGMTIRERKTSRDRIPPRLSMERSR